MLLVDSQVLMWVLDGSSRIGPRTRARLTASAAIHVSAATIWELTIKSMLGKIEVPDDLDTAITDQGFIELPVNAQHALAMRGFLELIGHDPFDRLLVAQAQCTGMTLLTADGVLLGLGRDFIVDARD